MVRMLLCLGLALASLLASAQAPKSAEMAALEFLSGTWKGDVTLFMGDKPLSGPATWTILPAMDGLYLQIEVSHELKPYGTVRGLSMLFFDKSAKGYRSLTFSNDPASVGKPREERMNLQGKKLIAEGESSGVKFRQEFDLAEPGLLRYRLVSTSGGKETVMASGELKKAD